MGRLGLAMVLALAEQTLDFAGIAFVHVNRAIETTGA
jgi:hypothetical protein